MIQSLPFQRARIPALALGALALVALGTAGLTQLSSGAGPYNPIVQQATSAALAQRPLIAQPESTACGAGAYVSGDLAGDASPAVIYSAMCER
jgi:hypothetical protein